MTNKSSTQARFKESSFKKGKFIAEQEHRSFNNLLEYLLDNYIKDYERKNGTISENTLKELK